MNKLETYSLCLLASLSSVQAHAKKAKKPNILVIYTDDHRYSGVHALGGEAVRTPNLDNLAHDGMAFTNTFLQGAFTGATSVPSRAMLHTGRNLFQLDGIGHHIPEEHTTMGQAFQKAGYYTYFTGKWHQDTQSLAREFHNGARLCGTPAYLTDQYRMPFSDWLENGNYKKENCYLLEYNAQGEVTRRPLLKTDKRGPVADEKHAPHVTNIIADAAIDFISKYDKKKPFFHYLAFPCPHDPRQADQKYHDMYPVDDMALTPSYMPVHPFDNGHMVLRDELLAPWPRTKDVAKKHLSDYYAIITHLDAQIGRVIKALKASGQYENTIIIMAGDSGLAVGNHGLIGKQNVYNEDGIHIPFIISGGLIETQNKGRRIDALCYVHDILPTLLDLAKVERPASVTGKSLLPVINNEVKTTRTSMYHAYRQFQRAYRKGDYKLIEFVRSPDKKRKGDEFVAGSRVTLLFNITQDPWETFNLAFLPEYADKVAELRKEMKQKAIEIGDTADGKRTNYDFWKYYTN